MIFGPDGSTIVKTQIRNVNLSRQIMFPLLTFYFIRKICKKNEFELELTFEINEKMIFNSQQLTIQNDKNYL